MNGPGLIPSILVASASLALAACGSNAIERDGTGAMIVDGSWKCEPENGTLVGTTYIRSTYTFTDDTVTILHDTETKLENVTALGQIEWISGFTREGNHYRLQSGSGRVISVEINGVPHSEERLAEMQSELSAQEAAPMTLSLSEGEGGTLIVEDEVPGNEICTRV